MRNSVASKSWLWLLGFTFPTLSSQSAAQLPGSRSIWCPLLPPALAGALPLNPVSSFRPRFLPFEAMLAPRGCFLLCSPRVVFTSLSEHMSWSALDDRWQDSSIFLLYYIHLPGGGNCVIFLSISPSPWHPMGYRVGSPPIFEENFKDKQLNLNIIWLRCSDLKYVSSMFI